MKPTVSRVGSLIIVIAMLAAAAGCAVGPVDHPTPISDRSDPMPQAGGGGGSGM